MSAQPHDVDVKALLRIATLYNVPTAINRSSADFLISSPLFEHDDYRPVVKDYTSYIERVLEVAAWNADAKGSTDPLFFRLQRGGEPPSSFSEALRSTARVLSAVRRRSMRGPHPLVPVVLPEANCLQFRRRGCLRITVFFSLSLTVS